MRHYPSCAWIPGNYYQLLGTSPSGSPGRTTLMFIWPHWVKFRGWSEKSLQKRSNRFQVSEIGPMSQNLPCVLFREVCSGSKPEVLRTNHTNNLRTQECKVSTGGTLWSHQQSLQKVDDSQFQRYALHNLRISQPKLGGGDPLRMTVVSEDQCWDWFVVNGVGLTHIFGMNQKTDADANFIDQPCSTSFWYYGLSPWCLVLKYSNQADLMKGSLESS
jgi:hypothetical protein